MTVSVSECVCVYMYVPQQTQRTVGQQGTLPQQTLKDSRTAGNIASADPEGQLDSREHCLSRPGP